MIVRYTELPGATLSGPRPVVDVVVADAASVTVPCLVDSGAVNTLLPTWIADVAGVDLVATERRELGLGGTSVGARFTTVSLSAAEFAWEASVGFCDPWPYAWGLLGHHGFFRWFTVVFRAVDHEFDLTPIET